MTTALANAQACEHCADTLERLAMDYANMGSTAEAERCRENAKWYRGKADEWMERHEEQEDAAA